MTPTELFKSWYAEELKASKVKIPSACCFSTVGTDGFPNARFVSMKEIVDNCFIVTGPLNSRKGLEVQACDKVALSFWWTETERQVRVQGTATKITKEAADKYFYERNRESQIVSAVSEQGQILQDPDRLNEKYKKLEATTEKIPRPKNWGGFSIQPKRIEFLEFSATRFHIRTLYELENGSWKTSLLQP